MKRKSPKLKARNKNILQIVRFYMYPPLLDKIQQRGFYFTEKGV